MKAPAATSTRQRPVPGKESATQRPVLEEDEADRIALDALKRHFGYPGFRPGQDVLVRAVLQGHDALGILPTGGGKSVCYQVPAAVLPHATIVVSPLVSLMADQAMRCREAHIPAAFLNSTLSRAERDQVEAQLVEGGLRVVFVAPERFESRSFRELLPRLRVSLLAVDEAHCISEWGHDFRPAYLRLGRLRGMFDAPMIALTATATSRTRREIVTRLRLADPVTVVGGFDRPNLVWQVRRVRSWKEKRKRLRALVRNRPGVTLIYASSRKGVESVRDDLAGLGYLTEAYHAGLPAAERGRVQDAFMAGDAPLVVATNAFGMGVDKSDVRLVIHHELPRTIEAYYQEAGRAGRDGDTAHCLALWSKGDRSGQMAFIDHSYPPPRAVRRFWRNLRKRAAGRERLKVPVDDMRTRDGTPLTPGNVGALARALAACRVVHLREDPPEEAGGTLHINLRPHVRRLPLGPLRKRRKAELGKLAAVERYARTRGCRRARILGYFGDITGPANCGTCDNCQRA